MIKCLTEEAAKRFAGQIETYWKERGYTGIRAWSEFVRDTAKASYYWRVNSNIGPLGYPPPEYPVRSSPHAAQQRRF